MNAPNRLDTMIHQLEQALKDRIEHPLRRLREAIAYQRNRGSFDEDFVMGEVERISHRERLSAQAYYEVGQEIDHLAERLLRSAPRKPS